MYKDLNFENWELQQSANIQFTLFPWSSLILSLPFRPKYIYFKVLQSFKIKV